MAPIARGIMQRNFDALHYRDWRKKSCRAVPTVS